MITTGTPQRKRRSIDTPTKPHPIRVQVDEATRARLSELSDRYGVAAGTIAREAIGTGLRAVTERLRRAARAAARDGRAIEHEAGK